MHSSNEQYEFSFMKNPHVAEAGKVHPITETRPPAVPIPVERPRIGIPHAPWRYALNRKRRDIDADDRDVPVC